MFQAGSWCTVSDAAGWPVAVARLSFRLNCPRARSSAVGPVLVFWHMWWSRSIAIICRCTASRKSIRRKFVDFFASQRSAAALDAIRRIAQLYAVEKEVRGQSPEARVALRQDKAKPVFDDLEAWLHAHPQARRVP